jgi:putative ABC transport system permease protein
VLLENIRSAFDALLANRLRSILTLLGVVIGVFAVTTTVSMGAIATAGITSEIQEFGAQTIFVSPNFRTPGATHFTDEDIEALSRLQVDILRQQSTRGTVISDESGLEVQISINGLTADSYRLDRSLKIARGRSFSAAEASRGAAVMVLSSGAATELFGSRNPIGEEISVLSSGNRSFYTVIGVKEPVGGAFAAFTSDISGDIPLETFHGDHPGVRRGQYSFLPITVPLDRSVSDTEEQVRGILDRRRGADSYSIESIEGALALFDTVTLILQAVLGGIGAVSLLVGGIGILNIMLVSVTERTREIGLRKALGARRQTIMQQFLIEAVVLTTVGGLLGLLLAIGVLHLVVAVVPFLGQVVINPWTLVVALLVSVLTGVTFGVWPASRAASLSPIEALRQE